MIYDARLRPSRQVVVEPFDLLNNFIFNLAGSRFGVMARRSAHKFKFYRGKQTRKSHDHLQRSENLGPRLRLGRVKHPLGSQKRVIWTLGLERFSWRDFEGEATKLLEWEVGKAPQRWMRVCVAEIRGDTGGTSLGSLCRDAAVSEEEDSHAHGYVASHGVKVCVLVVAQAHGCGVLGGDTPFASLDQVSETHWRQLCLSACMTLYLQRKR